MVPDWLRRKKPSGNAVLAYINLGSRGTFNPGDGTYDECRPAWETLAGDMGVSKSTAKRAVEELVELGAAIRTLRRNEDGTDAPSSYRLIFGNVVEPGQGRGSRVTPPQSTGEPGRGPRVTPNQEPFTKKNPLPPTPQRTETPAPLAAATLEEGEDSKTENNNTYVTPGQAAIVEKVRVYQPGWTERAIVQTLNDAVAGGRPPQLAGRALEELAAGHHGQTGSPRRLLADGPWWTTQHIAQKPTTNPTRPRCPQHRSYFADNCGGCRADALASA